MSDCNGTPAATCCAPSASCASSTRCSTSSTPAIRSATAAGRSLTISYRSGPTLPVGFDTPDAPLTGPIGGRAGRISRIVDHAGRVTDFGYDGDGYLTSLTQGEVLDPSGAQQHRPRAHHDLTYAGAGPNRQLASVVDPRGNDTTLAYETAAAPGLIGDKSVGQRATSITNRRNNATSFDYATGCARP